MNAYYAAFLVLIWCVDWGFAGEPSIQYAPVVVPPPPASPPDVCADCPVVKRQIDPSTIDSADLGLFGYRVKEIVVTLVREDESGGGAPWENGDDEPYRPSDWRSGLPKLEGAYWTRLPHSRQVVTCADGYRWWEYPDGGAIMAPLGITPRRPVQKVHVVQGPSPEMVMQPQQFFAPQQFGSPSFGGGMPSFGGGCASGQCGF